MSQTGNCNRYKQQLKKELASLSNEEPQQPSTCSNINTMENLNTFSLTLSPLPFPPKVEKEHQPSSDFFSSELIIVETPLPKQHAQIYQCEPGENFAIQTRIIFQFNEEDGCENSSELESSSIDSEGKSNGEYPHQLENENEVNDGAAVEHSENQQQNNQLNSHEQSQKSKKPSSKHRNISTNSAIKQISQNKKIFCNCKKTQCLKLYCDCFRLNQICEGCNCVGCHNIQSFGEERNNAILALMDRNPDPFGQKIEDQKHVKGCNCKKSNCLKKYCQCYQAGLKCGQNCKCQECKNCQDKNHDHELGPTSKNTAKKERKMVEYDNLPDY